MWSHLETQKARGDNMSEMQISLLEPAKTEPKLGEIRTAKDFGKEGWRKYIYTECPQCGKRRWLIKRKGITASQMCHFCFMQTIPRRHPNISAEADYEIRQLYLREKLSSIEIAKRLGVRLRLVTSAITRMDIARSFKEAARITKENGYSPVRGEQSHAWKGGWHNQGGYIYVYAPNHPRVKGSKDPNRRYIAEHILIWEQVHQRRLPPNWVVHHINGIKTDNRPENLAALKPNSHSTRTLVNLAQERIRALENQLRNKKG